MGKKGIIALLSCVFALCLALVGCGGGGSAESSKAAFTGTWDLVEMSQGDEVTGSDELDTLKSLGLEVYVNLNEDGTSALVLFGEVIDGTWEAKSTTEGTITMEGQEVTMTIADSKLTFEQEGATLTFEKGEAKETPSSTEESASESSSEESVSESAVEEESASESTAAEEAEDEATAEEGAAEAEQTTDEAAPEGATESTQAEGGSSSSSSAAA